MEKLQEALQKARARRHGQEGAPMPAMQLSSTGRPDALQAAWDGLNDLELDPAVLAKNRILSLKAGREGTNFDILRTKTQLLMQKNNWTRLAITSPTPSCGKTTTACNLVLGLSRQKGIRAILIELDLRRPMVARTLGFKPKHNINEMLSGEVAFHESAVRVNSNVAIAATRRAAQDPTSVLLAQSTQDTLEEIEATYKPDFVVFDLPPILVSDETRAFMTNVDCTMLLARAETSTMAQIDFCEKEIAEHTNVLGIVLNGCRHGDELNTNYDGYYY